MPPWHIPVLHRTARRVSLRGLNDLSREIRDRLPVHVPRMQWHSALGVGHGLRLQHEEPVPVGLGGGGRGGTDRHWVVIIVNEMPTH